METLRQRWVRMYAYAIYIDGTRRFSDIPASYVEEVKQYAAANFSLAQIDNAFAQGWITEQEWQSTMTYVQPAV